MSDERRDRILRRFMGQAVELGQPANSPDHIELNAMLRARGWTDEQINAAHEVARGNQPLSEACPNCENQELYYSTNLMYEGHKLIICKHCDAQAVDRANEHMNVELIEKQFLNNSDKALTGAQKRRRKLWKDKPQG